MALVARRVPSEILRSEAVDRWERLLAAQSGVFHVRQLRAFGVGQASTVAMVEGGRWQPVVHGVYAAFTGPLPRSSLIAAALQYGGAAAVLSHRTAAEEWSLLPPTDRPIHITVPYGTSAITQPGLIAVTGRGPTGTSSWRPTRRGHRSPTRPSTSRSRNLMRGGPVPRSPG